MAIEPTKTASSKLWRREGIHTLAEANRYLEEVYLVEHNARFAHTQGLADIHKNAQSYDLNAIFSFQYERQVRNDYTITLNGKFIQLLASDVPLPLPRRYVTVREYLDGSLHIFYHEQELAYRRLNHKPQPRNQPVKPHPNHPWRRYGTLRNRAPA